MSLYLKAFGLTLSVSLHSYLISNLWNVYLCDRVYGKVHILVYKDVLLNFYSLHKHDDNA